MTLGAGAPIGFEANVAASAMPPFASHEALGMGARATWGTTTAITREGAAGFRLTCPPSDPNNELNRKLWNLPAPAMYHGEEHWWGLTMQLGAGFVDSELNDDGGYHLSAVFGSHRADVTNGPGCALQLRKRDGVPWIQSRRENRNGQQFGSSGTEDLLWVAPLAECRDRLMDIVIHIKWGKSGAAGGHFREYYINGQLRARSTLPNLPNNWDPADGIRRRWGLYQGNRVSRSRTVYVDSIRWSLKNTGSLAEISPGSTPPPPPPPPPSPRVPSVLSLGAATPTTQEVLIGDPSGALPGDNIYIHLNANPAAVFSTPVIGGARRTTVTGVQGEAARVQAGLGSPTNGFTVHGAELPFVFGGGPPVPGRVTPTGLRILSERDQRLGLGWDPLQLNPGDQYELEIT